MINIQRRECPICETYDNVVLFKQAFADIEGITFLKGYNVVECKQCGFLYADKIPKQIEFDLYYKERSKYEVYLKELSADKISKFKKTLAFIEECLEKRGDYLKDLQIADIGCATGDFLRYLKDKGYTHLNGIDPSIICVEYMLEYGINARQATINDLDEQGKYDFIRLNAVLEHIEDLNSSMEKIKKMLKKDGYIYISVPDARGFKELVNCSFQEFSVEHINYFSKITLSNFMKKHGFDLIGYKSSYNRLYSELEAVFIYKGNRGKNSLDGIDDELTLNSMKQYITQNYQLEQEVNEKISINIDPEEPIIVWGVGTHTLRQLAVGQLGKCNIKILVDSNIHYQDKEYKGIPIISPEQIKMYDYKILISSYYAQNDIKSHIQEILKLKNQIVTLYNIESN